LVDAANGNANNVDSDRMCHLVTIPAGVLPSDVLLSSPIVSGSGGGSAVGGGASELNQISGGGGGGFADYGGRSKYGSRVSYGIACLNGGRKSASRTISSFIKRS